MNVREKIVELVYKNNESHLGSCLSCVEMVQAIYEVIRPQDKFILSKSHALRTVEAMGIIPQFVKEVCPYGGSLGNGVGIGIGMAIANPDSMVYVICGDGETDEGSFLESINYIHKNYIFNIKILIDCNGWSSMSDLICPPVKIVDGHNVERIKERLLRKHDFFINCVTIKGRGVYFLEDTLMSHYLKLNDAQYREALECVKNS